MKHILMGKIKGIEVVCEVLNKHKTQVETE